MKNEFLRLIGVEKVSLCDNAPASQNIWFTDVQLDGSDEKYDFNPGMRLVDEDYLSTFELKLLSGRNLSPSDTAREVLVNETLLKKLGIANSEEAIGRVINVNGGNMGGPIVGVVKDFHDKSFHEEISPTIFTTDGRSYSNFAVKLNPMSGKETLAQIEEIWQSNFPDQIFEFEFLDDSIAQFYQAEETILQGIQIFSFIAIFIGCLGLYGLVSFLVAQKTKEVGIRKVIGGSVGHIIWIFGKEFGRLIVIAFLIAAPVGWWFMSNWLKGFEFKIDLNIWVFAIAITCSILIAALTVGYQVIRAAVMKPAISLKTE
jgi:ABC-type antimicrobial peptide transport system permease subunit